jgi:hypothetical protein
MIVLSGTLASKGRGGSPSGLFITVVILWSRIITVIIIPGRLGEPDRLFLFWGGRGWKDGWNNIKDTKKGLKKLT